MLTYQIDGPILTLTLKGTPHELQRSMTYAEIAGDARVPPGVLVMVDIRRADPIDDPAEVDRRARTLVERLGPKLGSACAVIVPPRLATIAEHFQSMSTELGLRIALFRDEPDARRWLMTFNAR
jgi:hypothetical protein